MSTDSDVFLTEPIQTPVFTDEDRCPRNNAWDIMHKNRSLCGRRNRSRNEG